MSHDRSIEVLGDPRKLLEQAEKEFLDKLVDEVESIKRDGLDIISRVFDLKDRELRARIEEAVRSSRLRLESFRSKIEVEVKNYRDKIREEWVDKVFSEVKERIYRELAENTDRYRVYLSSALKSVLSGYGGRFVIEANKRTINIIEDIVRSDFKDYENKIDFRDSGSENVIGFIAYTPDGLIKFNYTLDEVFRSMEYDLKVIISKKLFG